MKCDDRSYRYIITNLVWWFENVTVFDETTYDESLEIIKLRIIKDGSIKLQEDVYNVDTT